MRGDSPTPAVLEHLAKLVSFDTQNPPRAITKDSEILNYLRQHLPDFEIEIMDSGDGCLSLLAIRGTPQLLFNFHIDTVPVAQGWSNNPFQLTLEDNKVFALGACDIKGAAACMLAAVSQRKGDIALLFSTDEEHGSSTAIKDFLKKEYQFDTVIVAEPTLARATLAHRGIQSASLKFQGSSGHASEARAYKDNAIHKATQWSAQALNWVNSQTQTFDSLQGLPFNIGKIEGGIKANMIAANCELSLGFRPLPGQDSQLMLKQLTEFAASQTNLTTADYQMSEGFRGPTLPAANQDFETAINNATELAISLNLTLGEAVNFWTEASLFSQAGYTAIVFGPGDIKQAHTANEWVAIEQLAKVESAYLQIIEQQKLTWNN